MENTGIFDAKRGKFLFFLRFVEWWRRNLKIKEPQKKGKIFPQIFSTLFGVNLKKFRRPWSTKRSNLRHEEGCSKYQRDKLFNCTERIWKNSFVIMPRTKRKSFETKFSNFRRQDFQLYHENILTRHKFKCGWPFWAFNFSERSSIFLQ